MRRSSPTAKWGGFRSLSKPVKRLIAVGFLFGLARFSESFLILKAIDAGLCGRMVAAGAGAVQPRLPGARLSRRRAQRPHRPAPCPARRDRAADRRRPVLAQARRACGSIGVGVVLWGAHMALTQGIFDPDDRRRRARATSARPALAPSSSSTGSRPCSPASAPGCCGTAAARPRPSPPPPRSPRWRGRCWSCCRSAPSVRPAERPHPVGGTARDR